MRRMPFLSSQHVKAYSSLQAELCVGVIHQNVGGPALTAHWVEENSRLQSC